MKIQNLPFAMLAVFMAIVCLAACGWVVGFMLTIDLAPFESVESGGLKLFGFRVFLGLTFIGLSVGLSRLWNFFVFVMSYAPLKGVSK